MVPTARHLFFHLPAWPLNITSTNRKRLGLHGTLLAQLITLRFHTSTTYIIFHNRSVTSSSSGKYINCIMSQQDMLRAIF